MVDPVAYDYVTLRREYRFGVELQAPDVGRAVAQGHDLPLVAEGRYLQLVGQTLTADDPRVVTSCLDGAGQ